MTNPDPSADEPFEPIPAEQVKERLDKGPAFAASINQFHAHCRDAILERTRAHLAGSPAKEAAGRLRSTIETARATALAAAPGTPSAPAMAIAWASGFTAAVEQAICIKAGDPAEHLIEAGLRDAIRTRRQEGGTNPEPSEAARRLYESVKMLHTERVEIADPETIRWWAGGFTTAVETSIVIAATAAPGKASDG